jgi:hypothetical protein
MSCIKLCSPYSTYIDPTPVRSVSDEKRKHANWILRKQEALRNYVT